MSATGVSGTTPGTIELLGIERLEEHARGLGALLTVASLHRGGSRTHLKRLRQHAQKIRQVYTALADDATRGEPSSPAAEWLLDNFHILLSALRDGHHDRPGRVFPPLPH